MKDNVEDKWLVPGMDKMCGQVDSFCNQRGSGRGVTQGDG